MKTFLTIGLFVLSFLITTSFDPKGTDTEKLIGVWVYSGYDKEQNIVIYERRSKFDDDEAGIEFRQNNKLIKRQNTGWCGTPPISYGNYDGKWEVLTDSTIHLQYDYWGGVAEEDWKFSEISDKYMKILWAWPIFHEDYAP